MIEPIRLLLQAHLGLDVTAEEVSAGYGIADLVGASLNQECCLRRAELGLDFPLDRHAVQVLTVLKSDTRTSFDYLLKRTALSESTLRRQVLPRLVSRGLVQRYADGFLSRVIELPKPSKHIVAVEAKQTRWRDAILQARRYTFFADRTYVAVWNGTARLVDRHLLYRHRLGLIGVEPEGAEIIVEAPVREPRSSVMSQFCGELLYGQAILAASISSSSTSTSGGSGW